MDKIANMEERLMEKEAGFLDNMKDTAGKAFNAVKQKVPNLDKAVDFAKGIPGKAANAAKAVGTKAGNFAKSTGENATKFPANAMLGKSVYNFVRKERGVDRSNKTLHVKWGAPYLAAAAVAGASIYNNRKRYEAKKQYQLGEKNIKLGEHTRQDNRHGANNLYKLNEQKRRDEREDVHYARNKNEKIESMQNRIAKKSKRDADKAARAVLRDERRANKKKQKEQLI